MYTTSADRIIIIFVNEISNEEPSGKYKMFKKLPNDAANTNYCTMKR